MIGFISKGYFVKLQANEKIALENKIFDRP